MLDLPTLPGGDAPIQGEKSFPTFVPWEYLRRIRTGDHSDPLLRQVLAVSAEDQQASAFGCDPVGDRQSIVAAGLLQKYDRRALLIVNGTCGIHCRYCFRREFPYSEEGSRRQNWQPAIDYLRDHHDIEELLLSGGDPLTLVDQQLDKLIYQIESIPHIRRLRIHTRMPIVIPQRVTDALLLRLQRSRLAVWMVIHANHPNELDDHVLSRLTAFVDRGIPVLNQSVLLRGVNNDAEVLSELSRKLIDHRVQPYYLHQLDRVRGAAHFEVSQQEGKRLVRRLRSSLPGYAVPEYVVEVAGEPSKSVVFDQDRSCM